MPDGNFKKGLWENGKRVDEIEMTPDEITEIE
jgi:hypothetical protein